MATLPPAVTAADEEFEPPLYVARKKIYPQAVSGQYRRIKWALLIITLGIYYLLPFVRWDRGPNAPSQAVLIDFPNRRFYFFFIEIWPQEVYYLTGLLIIAAVALFLMNAVAGRVWCGYLCPQTVWTDLFYAVERLFEGDHRERMRRDQGPKSASDIAFKTGKHLVWLIIAWWTGGAWVLYFADAPTLMSELATGKAPVVAYVWIGILTFTTYALAGHMREQVCTYMCPWPRIQAALTDEDALNVTYRYDRGEPRASVKKSKQLRAAGEPAGDCIDCFQCVAVCPTGVDIRQGTQLGCIQCGLCIDACDSVMAKIGRPTRLIAYDTDLNVKRRLEGKSQSFRIVRPRTMLYAAIILLVGAIMVVSLGTRSTSGINIIHDRNPVYVRLSDGALRNAYTVRLLNKELQAQRFTLSVEGLEGADLRIVGVNEAEAADPVVEVGPDQTREVRVLVTTHEALPAAASIPLTFHAAPEGGGRPATANDHFVGP
ncbi:MAG: cytochrome c oxidase accessory protein CcoG [Deltaproteobacteria bacterium]|nr:cytochrome c oxidase accessory protein CcoG [Deltaproteobacteria bacterium]